MLFAMHIKNKKTTIDDSLDVFACHGVGSTWGVFATGIFASMAINSAGANGLIYGNFSLIKSQFIAVIVTGVYSFIMTVIILKILNATMVFVFVNMKR